MHRISRYIRRLRNEEEGITGLETAIILIAFVIVASVFAFVVLSTGLVSADKGRQTVIAGLDKAQGNLEVRGSVTAAEDTTTPTKVGTVTFNLSLAAAGTPILVDPAGTTNSVVINYLDAAERDAKVTYTVNVIQGNSDSLLEPGELMEITVTVPTTATLNANESFSLEVVPPTGGTLLITRTTPPALAAIMDLH